MANVLIESQTMTDIADAIREKNGTSNAYLPAEMPKAINEIANEIPINTTILSDYATSISGMFSNIHNSEVKELAIDVRNANLSSMSSTFATISNVEIIKIYSTNNNDEKSILKNVSSYRYCFQNAFNLREIHCFFNFSSIDNSSNIISMFTNCKELVHVRIVENSLKCSISFSYSAKLSAESVQSIIDGLADLTGQTSQTLSLHALVKEKLTDEQIAQITSKNWTLA